MTMHEQDRDGVRDVGATVAVPLGLPDELIARGPDAVWEHIAGLREQDRRRARELRHEGAAVYKAVGRWAGFQGAADWQGIVARARDAYASGGFLIEQLGGEQYLHPELMATLWSLRQRLLDQFDPVGPAEEMLVDMAVLGYYNTLRVQGWVGNAAMLIEHELFLQESPTLKLKEDYGAVANGLRVEDTVKHLVEQLMPLLDRANRMFLRNLHALAELRRPPAPSVAIGQAAQVNVASQQVNAQVAARAPANEPRAGTVSSPRPPVRRHRGRALPTSN